MDYGHWEKMKNTLLYCLVFWTMLSCEKKEDKLNEKILTLNRMIMSDSSHRNEIDKMMSAIEGQLTNSVTKQHIPDSNWRTSVKYNWNHDSSIVMIHSLKRIYKDIKRERILNLNDTAIISLRNDLWFDESRRKLNGIESPGYIFLEEIHYLTAKGPKKIIKKMDFDNNQLADTVRFKKVKFTDYTSTDQANFKDEFDYSKKILTYN
jgi:hypothetical protein